MTVVHPQSVMIISIGDDYKFRDLLVALHTDNQLLGQGILLRQVWHILSNQGEDHHYLILNPDLLLIIQLLEHPLPLQEISHSQHNLVSKVHPTLISTQHRDNHSILLLPHHNIKLVHNR